MDNEPFNIKDKSPELGEEVLTAYLGKPYIFRLARWMKTPYDRVGPVYEAEDRGFWYWCEDEWLITPAENWWRLPS